MKKKEVLKSVMASDARKIKETYEMLDETAFQLAVNTIRRARNRYIIGVQKCAPLASYLAAQMNLVFDNVRLAALDSAQGLLEQLVHIGEKDVLIAIDFPRYSIGTVKAVEFASERKAKIITVTDDPLAPVNLYASCKLVAASDRTAIADSLVAPMSLLNVLVVAASMNRRSKVVDTLETLEGIYKDYQLNLSQPEEEQVQIYGISPAQWREKIQEGRNPVHE